VLGFVQYFTQAEHGLSMSAILLRLLIAAVLGIAIGTERQWRHHPAGIQTSSLVCFGAALYSLITPALGAANDYRIVASIVTGVGFLAGGVILKEGFSVTGLNTAATIWSTAAVGALAGVGLLEEAAIAAFTIIALNLFFFPFTKWVDARANARQGEPPSDASS
jgi:putative Mg2+ transporter-C (MgtC) family protein